eukprot:TRINITY_DN16243_c0_g2_i1.p1 TRINITY_DN16243_c0_g2~~TRINITY_DN16243_c0_g2_i1.p1  ORF type:complete len:873 (-),score=207.02 TRINITY_DN16243_c0_g2_i1:331-2949(-)
MGAEDAEENSPSSGNTGSPAAKQWRHPEFKLSAPNGPLTSPNGRATASTGEEKASLLPATVGAAQQEEPPAPRSSPSAATGASPSKVDSAKAEAPPPKTKSERIQAAVAKSGTSKAVVSKMLRLFLGNTVEDPVAHMEAKLYSTKHHTQNLHFYHKGSHELLMADKLFRVQTDRSVVQDSVGKKEEEASQGIMRCVIDRQAKILSVVLLVSVVVTSFCAPLTFIWGGSMFNIETIPMAPLVLTLDVLADIVYASWLVLLLRMSYIDPHRKVEVAGEGMIKRYRWNSLSYWLMWFSTFSYPLVFVGSLLGEEVLDSPMFLNNIKMIRLLHFVKLPDPLWRLGDDVTMLFCRPIVLLILASHWGACILACKGGYRTSLETHKEEAFVTASWDGSDISGQFSLYFMAFIEALYMLTGALDNPTGDGSVRDHDFRALIIVMVGGPLGCIVVSLFVATVIRTGELNNALEIRQEENRAFVKRALETLDVPKGLQQRVYSLHLFQRMNHDSVAFGVLFGSGSLSEPLELALRVYLYNKSVLASPFFQSRNDNYILEVVRVLDDQVFLPGDYLIRRGELGNEMYFIGRGSLTVLGPDKAVGHVSRAYKLAKKQAGDYFGEITLLRECKRTAWVRADTYVIAPVLHRCHIEPIWKFFPEEREILTAHVKGMVRENIQHKWKNAKASALALLASSVEGPSELDEISGVNAPVRASAPVVQKMPSMKEQMNMVVGSIADRLRKNRRHDTAQSSTGHRATADRSHLPAGDEDEVAEELQMAPTRTLKDIDDLTRLTKLCEQALHSQENLRRLLEQVMEGQEQLEEELRARGVSLNGAEDQGGERVNNDTKTTDHPDVALQDSKDGGNQPAIVLDGATTPNDTE